MTQAREPIKLTAQKLARLIERSSHGERVSCYLSTGGVLLRWWECEWTLPILAEMRGVME